MKEELTLYKVNGFIVAGKNEKIGENLGENIKEYGRHFNIASTVIEPGDPNYDELLNNKNLDLAIPASYFGDKTDIEENPEYPYEVKADTYFRHFKGKVIHVIRIGENTENVGSHTVMYEEVDGRTWCRPLWMFLSPVDKVKYPDVETEWRFTQVTKEDYEKYKKEKENGN